MGAAWARHAMCESGLITRDIILVKVEQTSQEQIEKKEALNKIEGDTEDFFIKNLRPRHVGPRD